MMRFAPTAAEAAAAAAKAAAARGAAPGGGGGAGGGRGRGNQPSPVKADDWNDVDIVLDANILRPSINGRTAGGGAADEEVGKFGPLALLCRRRRAKCASATSPTRTSASSAYRREQVSANFRMQRLTPYYYSFSAAAADMNRDGHLDVVAGPFIYYGPDYTEAREFYAAPDDQPVDNASRRQLGGVRRRLHRRRLARRLLASTDGSRLYVNPKGEARRWDVYPNVIPPANQSEAVA